MRLPYFATNTAVYTSRKREQRSATDPNPTIIPTIIPMMYVVLLEESPASGLATRFEQEVTDSSDSSGQ
jgi:hypothetical protein